MTAPARQSVMVATNSQRSASALRSIRSDLAPARMQSTRPFHNRADQFFENAATMLVIFELIETGTGRSQQHGIACTRAIVRERHGALEGSGALGRHRTAELGGNFFRSRADQQNELGPLAQQGNQWRVIAALILAAENYKKPAGKSLESLDGGVHVGRLGVVEKTDSRNFRNKFETMLHAREAAHGASEIRSGDAGEKSGRCGGQHVFEVVLAAQADVGATEERNVFSLMSTNDLLALQTSAAGDALGPAEPEYLRSRRPMLGAGGIVGIDHRQIVLGLVLENARLGPRVIFEGGMPVEVIRSEIQQNGDVRAKSLDQLELETAELRDRNCFVARLIHVSDQRRADVSGNHYRLARGGQNVANQRSGRGLAVRAGHANDTPPQKSPRQFDLAPYGHMRRARRRQHGMIRRHARAGHDQILRREVRARIAAKGKRTADFAQFERSAAKLLLRPVVNGRHAGAARGAKARRGDAGSRQPHDQHAFAFEFDSRTHSYLSFNVVSENSANTSATIQKRTMIFDSLQPASSKW